MWAARLVAALVLLAGLPALADTLFPRLPNGATPPDWRVTPSPATIDEMYPELANDLGVGGRAVIACRVGSDGRVELCRPMSESFPGLGFGAAAVGMAPSFRFRPAMTISGPVASTVDVPVRFVPPPDDLRRLIPWMALLAMAATAWARHDRTSRKRIGTTVLGPEVQSR